MALPSTEEKVFFEGAFGRVCGVLHMSDPAKEIAVIVHGFSSNKSTGAVQIAHELSKIEVSALRIDLDNQGESELDFKIGACIPNYVKQVEAAIAYCKGLGYKDISLIGTSYGGTTVFATVLLHPEIKRLILRCPVTDYKEHALWVYGEEKLKQFKKQGFVPYYNKENKRFDVTFDFIEKSYSYSMYNRAKEVQVPTLIIQGDMDKLVDPKCAAKAVKYFPNARLRMIKGAGHALDVNGDFSEQLKAITDFFK